MLQRLKYDWVMLLIRDEDDTKTLDLLLHQVSVTLGDGPLIRFGHKGDGQRSAFASPSNHGELCRCWFAS